MAEPALSRVDKFLASVLKRPSVARGSVVLAVDATASRQPTWDAASHLLGTMFNEVAAIGSLDVQAVYFRGTGNVDAECKASNWLSDPVKLAAYMTGVTCRAGLTQITRVLDHTLRESDHRKIGALVYVGDCCEEPRDHLAPLARRLADINIPIFVFQEGPDLEAELAFRELAQITHGAFQRFDAGSAKQLGELLRAVAAFAVGGIAALEQQSSAAAARLLGQVR